jgi:hypothetical protein
MRIYPDLPGARARALAIDALMVLALLGCVWMGTYVHDTVAKLDALGRGAQQAGRQVRTSFAQAADRVEEAPVIGGRLERTFRSAGREVSEPLIESGARGRRQVEDLATTLGWIVGGVPAVAMLVPFLLWRIWRVRRLLVARRVLAMVDRSPEHRRLLATRAAFTLPIGTLLRVSSDPLGDLEAGRFDPLLAALGRSYGLRVPVSAP